MSEQMVDDPTANGGTHPAFPFLTGHGGANQVNLFAYLGLRLLPDDYLYIDPSLPPQITHLKYRTFYWHGWPLAASSNQTHTTIGRAKKSRHLDTADRRFANTTISVRVGMATDNSSGYELPVTGMLTIPNRQIGSVSSIPGNLVQCRPVYSDTEYRPGQFPIGVVDGASSTKWQPYYASNISSVTVMLDEARIGSDRDNKAGSGSSVSGFSFEWAQAPPVNLSVVFHNATLSRREMQELKRSIFSVSAGDNKVSRSSRKYTVVTTLTNITLSHPYDPLTYDPTVITQPTGNATNVTLAEPVAIPRFATLFVAGNQGLGIEKAVEKDGMGATVAEWAILE